MLIQRETPDQSAAVHAVTAAAFAGMPYSRLNDDNEPTEAWLVDELRAGDAWLPALSLVAVAGDGPVGGAVERAGGVAGGAAGGGPVGAVVGHVVCTRARLAGAPVLGLGPLSVHPDHQRRGVGSALVHAVLGAADALDEPLVVLLGDPAYYGRFGFRPAHELGITPPVADWVDHFQARPLTAYDGSLRGEFVYPEPFLRA
jgi:putative acetyltransferase